MSDTIRLNEAHTLMDSLKYDSEPIPQIVKQACLNRFREWHLGTYQKESAQTYYSDFNQRSQKMQDSIGSTRGGRDSGGWLVLFQWQNHDGLASFLYRVAPTSETYRVVRERIFLSE